MEFSLLIKFWDGEIIVSCVRQCEKDSSFEDRWGPQAKECDQPLEAGKGKKIYTPLQPLRNKPWATLILAPWDSILRLIYKTVG